MTIVRVFSACHAQGVTPMKRSAIDYLTKIGIEQMNRVPGKVEIYPLVEIFERPLIIPKRPLIENIDIIIGVRGTKTQRPVSPSR